MADYRERLRRIRDRISGRHAFAPNGGEVSASSSKGARSKPTREVHINFGIDFGTSFTKVCFRDVGAQETGIVAAGKGSKGALVPSVVLIGEDGQVFMGDDAGRLTSPITVTYLKMRLAGTPIGDILPVCHGLDLNETKCVRALSAWFLASVISRSQDWIRTHQSDRLKNRNPVWSANVGVPVEHYDSDALEIFEEVLGVAWRWIEAPSIPATVQEAVSEYELAAASLASGTRDFHAIPEIAAAVQSFVMSREAVPGVYVYFDIGGGTVDGVAFRYLNFTGERRINFYSGKVAPIGVSAIGASLAGDGAVNIDVTKLESLLKNCVSSTESNLVTDIRRLVAAVIMTAKQKDPSNWQLDTLQSAEYERKYIGPLSPSRMRPLIVFIGGGGSKSRWYRTAIESTYKAFQHDRAGIPPYETVEVPLPPDLTMSDANDEFIRFAISYGLSIPLGEGPEIGLPSQFDVAEPPKRWSPPGMVDYADSKDVYG